MNLAQDVQIKEGLSLRGGVNNIMVSRSPGFILILLIFLAGSIAGLVYFNFQNIPSQSCSSTMDGSGNPSPIATDGFGSAAFDIMPGGIVRYAISVDNVDDILAAHIHVGAPGFNGPISAFLIDEQEGVRPSPFTLNGQFNVFDLKGPLEGKSIADLVELMELGITYVNVHSAVYPAGEIRGVIQCA